MPLGKKSSGKSRSRTRSRRTVKNRALKLRHKMTVTDDTTANRHDDWEMVAPANGILSKIQVTYETNDSDLVVGTDDGYLGLLWSKQDMPASPEPLGTDFDGKYPDKNQVSMDGIALLPLYIKDLGTDIEQHGNASTQCVHRMEAGDSMYFKATIWDDLFDDQALSTIIFVVTVFFSMVTDLSKYQETVPVAILLSDDEGHGLHWKPPCQGMLYGAIVLGFGCDDDKNMTLSFGYQSNAAMEVDRWVEVASNARSKTYMHSEKQGHTLFVPQYYIGDKGFSMYREDEEGNEGCSYLLTGWFAPLPGSTFKFNLMEDAGADIEEVLPFPMHIGSVDVSQGWTGATAGTELITIHVRNSITAGLTGTSDGTSDLFENSELIYSYICGATSGQDREDEFVDLRTTFGDEIVITAAAAVSRYRVIVAGMIPDHNFKIRPCTRFIESPYVVEAGDYE